MKFYVDGQVIEAPLYQILTPALYEKITPMLLELAQSKGAQTAAEQEILNKVYAVPHLSEKINLQKGADAFADIMNDFRFQEIVKDAYLKVRENLFEVINIDTTTIPLIFEFVKTVVDVKKVTNAQLLVGLQSETNSEFWASQDLDGILDDLKFFRNTVCKRVRIS
jgi:hypothetical protein